MGLRAMLGDLGVPISIRLYVDASAAVGIASRRGLGIRAMLGDLGVPTSIRIYVDASAAVGIASRRGLGKQRHIELTELWLQDQVARGRIKIQKVDGKKNISDSLTKHSKADRIEQTMSMALHKTTHGRHVLMPEV